MTRTDVEQAIRDLQVRAYNGVMNALDLEEVMDKVDEYAKTFYRMGQRFEQKRMN